MQVENGIIVKLTESISDVSEKFVEAIAELRSDLKNLTTTVKDLSANNTKRLDKHSDELDGVGDRLTKLEAFRESEEKSKTRNIAIMGIISTLLAGAISTLLYFILGGN